MFWPRKYRRLNFPDSDPILKASAIARPKAKAALLQVEGCSEESSIGGKLSESSKNEFLFASKKYIGLWLRVLSLRLLQKRHRRSAQPRLMGRGQVVKLVYFLWSWMKWVMRLERTFWVGASQPHTPRILHGSGESCIIYRCIFFENVPWLCQITGGYLLQSVNLSNLIFTSKSLHANSYHYNFNLFLSTFYNLLSPCNLFLQIRTLSGSWAVVLLVGSTSHSFLIENAVNLQIPRMFRQDGGCHLIDW